MQLSDIPAWFAKRFGADATGPHIRQIPATTADPNAASMAIGFPPNTFVDIGAGGVPPDGRDFNGILNFLSAWAQWQGLGAGSPWSATIRDGAGGYPLGSIVLSATTPGRQWQSTVNNNMTNPDSGGAGWVMLVDRAATPAEMIAGTATDRVVTPALLAGAGYDRVISQSLIANGGFRIFASGYKECWGTATFIGNATTSVTYPFTFDVFSNAVCTAANLNVNAQDNNPAVYSCTRTGFQAWNAVDNPLSGYWQAKGR